MKNGIKNSFKSNRSKTNLFAHKFHFSPFGIQNRFFFGFESVLSPHSSLWFHFQLNLYIPINFFKIRNRKKSQKCDAISLPFSDHLWKVVHPKNNNNIAVKRLLLISIPFLSLEIVIQLFTTMCSFISFLLIPRLKTSYKIIAKKSSFIFLLLLIFSFHSKRLIKSVFLFLFCVRT